jgi:hypothetical protein
MNRKPLIAEIVPRPQSDPWLTVRICDPDRATRETGIYDTGTDSLAASRGSLIELHQIITM